MVSGKHAIIELYGCNYDLLSDVDFIKQTLISIAQQLGSRVISEHFVKLEPGISGVVVIGESHISIHTWPEESYASLDIYTCSKTADIEKAMRSVKTHFQPKHQYTLLVERGLPEGPKVSVIRKENILRRRKPETSG